MKDECEQNELHMKKHHIHISELKMYITKVLNEGIDKLNSRSREYVYILDALKHGVINPNDLLIISIPLIKNLTDLSLLGIALRNDADPNIYVSTDDGKKAHILIYAYYTSQNLELRKDIILMLMLSGAKIDQVMYEYPHMSLNVISSPLMIEQKKDNMKIHDFFKAEKFEHYDNIMDTFSDLDKNKQLIIGTFLDRPELISKIKDIIPNEVDVILSHSKNVIDDYKFTSNIREYGDSKFMDYSIDYAYFNGVKRSIELGFLPTYFSMNQIIINYRKYFINKNEVLAGEYLGMLYEAINSGVYLDLEQMAIISSTNEHIAKHIIDLYEKPIWMRSCSNNSKSNDYLKNLAFNFNIEGSKKEICEQLEVLSKEDSDKIKESVIKRQQLRATNKVSTLNEFVNSNPKRVECSNKTTLLNNPFEYNDASVSFYRDGVNECDPVWCFTSDMFEGLLSSGINPNTSKPLPSSFKNQLKTQLEIFKELKISPSNPISITKTLALLKKTDEISGDESMNIVNSINQVSLIQNQNIPIATVPAENMNKILAKYDMQQSYFNEINRNHQIITFCRAVYVILKSDPNIAKTIFTT